MARGALTLLTLLSPSVCTAKHLNNDIIACCVLPCCVLAYHAEMAHEHSALAVPLSGALTRCPCACRRNQTDKMDFLYIFMNHLCPSIGAVIALLMFASPMKAVMRANKEKSLGVRCLLAHQLFSS